MNIENELDTAKEEAILYEKMENNKVRCHLCAHECTISDGEKGICQVRKNRKGTLYTLVYGRTITRHTDPIEKKPLFHFYPGIWAYSMATVGCNFRCQWCQNWEISQMPRERHFVSGSKADPEEIVTDARNNNCPVIAYTYTEPTIFFEYAFDTAKIATQAGMKNIYITNGYMTNDMLERFAPYLNAVNIDLKAFRDETYRKYVGARLDPVLQNLKTIKQRGIWLEVTTLVIPGINDSPEEIRDAVTFIVEELGTDTPWHISRFFPAYKMTDVPPTPMSKLKEVRDIGKEAGLHYVYLGNAANGEDTYCSDCGTDLIKRVDYRIIENRLSKDGGCPVCGLEVAGVGMNS